MYLCRPLLLLPLLLAAAPFAAADALPSPPPDLAAYVARPEPGYAWTLQTTGDLGSCDYWLLRLTSQVWHDIPWEHDLVIVRPKDAAPTRTMLLINNGGKFNPKYTAHGIMLANLVRAPVAIVLGVPRQPLFDGKTEDRLVAETFVRYLETEDGSWPLLFPMVKSVVKGMDAIQAFTTQEWGADAAPEKFIVTGASKRGWTTWLTAAADSRVSAIAPMVIDLLNIPEQIALQKNRLGNYSEQIKPYTERQLVPSPDTPQARHLWTMVDPWSYRAGYTMPKMIVLGNNDRFWSPDALNLYWEGLPGPKYISYTPNAGHDLSPRNAAGKRELPMRALNNIAAFVRSQLTGRELPSVNWKHDDLPSPDGPRLRLTLEANPAPTRINLWTATAPTTDFRNARWESRPVDLPSPSTGGSQPVVITLDPPPSGHLAFYADLGYRVDELPLWLCTQLRIASAAAPVAPPAHASVTR